MKLHQPFVISARLLPAVKVGNGWISLSDKDEFVIDLPDGAEYWAINFRPGRFNRKIESWFESILAFLGAAAESYVYRMRTGREGENEALFPSNVVEWAYQNSDEIDMLRFEIEGSETPLIEP